MLAKKIWNLKLCYLRCQTTFEIRQFQKSSSTTRCRGAASRTGVGPNLRLGVCGLGTPSANCCQRTKDPFALLYEEGKGVRKEREDERRQDKKYFWNKIPG